MLASAAKDAAKCQPSVDISWECGANWSLVNWNSCVPVFPDIPGEKPAGYSHLLGKVRINPKNDFLLDFSASLIPINVLLL